MNKSSERSYRSIIVSPGFLLALILLLLNDHLLKHHFPGIITGKLSDFSGLFLVGLLLLSCRRIPASISLITLALTFIWWKSPLSDNFIVMWGELGLPALQRVSDYTDLLALLSLPLSHKYVHYHHEISRNRLLHIPIIVSTAFAIGATSMPLYSISMQVPNPKPLDSTLSSSNSSLCDIQLVRDIDRIVQEQGYNTIDDSDKNCSFQSSNDSTQIEHYRHYIKGESELTIYYNKHDQMASVNVVGPYPFRDQSEALRRSLRDKLMQYGYSLQVGNRIIRQQPSAHVQLLITPTENGDPLYPSHYYDLLRLPLIIDSQLLKSGFHPVEENNCGNDAYYGRERICMQYLEEDAQSQTSLITITLTAYLIYGQPPMEVSIVQFGNSNKLTANFVARELQKTIERTYSELTVEVIASRATP